MNHVLSTHLFVNHRLTTALAGANPERRHPAVEIFCAKQHLDYNNRAQVTELGHWFRDSELQLYSAARADVHGRRLGPLRPALRSSPSPSRSNRKRIADGGRDQARARNRRAGPVPLPDPAPWGRRGGVTTNASSTRPSRRSKNCSVFAKQRGVEVLLENIPNGLSSAERLVLFSRRHAPAPRLLLRRRATPTWARASKPRSTLMKDRIRSTHVHDNNGETTSTCSRSSTPGGTIDWKQTMDLLRSRPDQYPLLLELKETPSIEHPLETCTQVFDRLENL